jgi:hypothetical protein
MRRSRPASKEKTSMSTFTRYGFGLLIALYGLYQLRNAHWFAGLLAIAVAAGFVLFARSRR